MKNILQFKYLLPYLYGCGILWMITYWSTFEINIFEYINITDIITLIIYPLLIGLALNLIFFLFNIIISIDDNSSSHKEYDNFLLSNKKIGIIVKYVYILTIMFLLAATKERFKFLFLPFIASPLLSYFLFKTKFMMESIQHNLYRWYASILLVLIPLFSLSDGKRRALEIFENKKFSYTTISLPCDSESKVKYLGKAGNFYIFISMDNCVRYFKNINENLQLELRIEKNAP